MVTAECVAVVDRKLTPRHSKICSERARPHPGVERAATAREGHTAWVQVAANSRWLNAPASINRPAFRDASILTCPLRASAARTRPDETRPVPLQPAGLE